MSNIAQTVARKPGLDRAGVTRIVVVFLTAVLFGVLLFVSAGRFDWPAAWAFIALYLGSFLVGGLWVLTRNPGVINERGKSSKNDKPWDRIIAIPFALGFLLLYVVAGLDARWNWSTVPFELKVLAAIAFVLSMALVYWTMVSNPYLSTTVRIQDDRGHQTVSSGPYRYVRHPMYASMFVYEPCTALILGSWWALVAAAVVLVVLVVRTTLEDRMLHAELPGYREYAQQVRYRLIPGIW